MEQYVIIFIICINGFINIQCSNSSNSNWRASEVSKTLTVVTQSRIRGVFFFLLIYFFACTKLHKLVKRLNKITQSNEPVDHISCWL